MKKLLLILLLIGSAAIIFVMLETKTELIDINTINIPTKEKGIKKSFWHSPVKSENSQEETQGKKDREDISRPKLRKDASSENLESNNVEYVSEKSKKTAKGLFVWVPGKNVGSFISSSGPVIVNGVRLHRVINYNTIIVEYKKKYGVLGRNGKYILLPEYDEVKPGKSNYYGIRLKGLWGFAEAKGKVLIDYKYEEIFPFNGKTTWVKYGGKWGMINIMDEQIQPFIFDKPRSIRNHENFFMNLNGKWGMVDGAGKIIFNSQFDNIEYIGDNCFKYQMLGLWGLINEHYRYVTGNIYEEVGNIRRDNKGLIKAKLNGYWGFINKNGLTVIQHMYQLVLDYSYGLAVVKRNNRYGFINHSNEIVIPIIYENAESFENMGNRHQDKIIAMVLKGKKWYYIKPDGEVVLNRYMICSDFNNGRALIRQELKYGYIDKKGKIVISCQYDEAREFKDTRALVKRNGKWGFIDSNNNIKIPFIYDFAESFHEDLAKVFRSGKYLEYVNINGESVFKIENSGLIKYFNHGNFYNGMAFVREGMLVGFINKQGKKVIPCIYSTAYDFTCDVTSAKKGTTWVIINKKGDVILNSHYQKVGKFSDGLARVKNGNGIGFINTKGNLVIRCGFSDAKDFSEGKATVRIGDKYGYINKKGDVIIQPCYSYADPFKENTALVEKNGRLFFIDQLGNVIHSLNQPKEIYINYMAYLRSSIYMPLSSEFNYNKLKVYNFPYFKNGYARIRRKVEKDIILGFFINKNGVLLER